MPEDVFSLQIILLFALCCSSLVVLEPYDPLGVPLPFVLPRELRQRNRTFTPFIFLYEQNTVSEELKAALEFAANGIIASLLNLNLTIYVQVNITQMPPQFLGAARPAAYCGERIAGGALWYPAAAWDNKRGYFIHFSMKNLC
jgi:hypothetical protein